MDKFGYHIIDFIGGGQFGAVYKCADRNNNICCVKQIKLEDSSNHLAAIHFQMIQQEIYLLQHLAHPRIISLHGYFPLPNNNDICIVMEYAPFGPLSKMIAQRYSKNDFLSECKIKKFLIDMVLGIEYLHMKNVVHKDLKPCNILICDNERLKIADFGVSKITDIENNNLPSMLRHQKRHKEAGGSPIYMAPETLIHNRFSFASDIWALGCILYELCMLSAAFGSVQSMDDLIRCTLTKDYVQLSCGVQQYSNQLAALCDHMMMVDVDKRATIKDVITNPLILIDYYHSYFQFGVLFAWNSTSTYKLRIRPVFILMTNQIIYSSIKQVN